LARRAWLGAAGAIDDHAGKELEQAGRRFGDTLDDSHGARSGHQYR